MYILSCRPLSEQVGGCPEHISGCPPNPGSVLHSIPGGCVFSKRLLSSRDRQSPLISPTFSPPPPTVYKMRNIPLARKTMDSPRGLFHKPAHGVGRRLLRWAVAPRPSCGSVLKALPSREMLTFPTSRCPHRQTPFCIITCRFPLKYRTMGTLVLRDISQISLPAEPKCQGKKGLCCTVPHRPSPVFHILRGLSCPPLLGVNSRNF